LRRSNPAVERMSFTEACVAVAIVATTMTIASPSLIRARDTYVLKSAARDVASRMHMARIAAITGNRKCRLRVTSPLSLAVECQDTAWELIEDVMLPRGITVTATTSPEFHRRGYVTPAATISLWDKSARCIRVIVNMNGRVRIQ
jgi:type II secretory pathway pseudopilin PulG